MVGDVGECGSQSPELEMGICGGVTRKTEEPQRRQKGRERSRELTHKSETAYSVEKKMRNEEAELRKCDGRCGRWDLLVTA